MGRVGGCSSPPPARAADQPAGIAPGAGRPSRPAPQDPQKTSSGSIGSAQLWHTVCCGISYTHVLGRARLARSTISILVSARSANRASTR